MRGNPEEGLTHNNKCRDMKKGVRSSSVREWVSEEEEGVGEKSNSLSLYKGGRGDVSPHLPDKTSYSLGTIIDGAVGLPMFVLTRIP